MLRDGGAFLDDVRLCRGALTVTQPVTFLQLIWAVLLGAIMFGEAVDGLVILGGALILGAISFITWREALARRQITPPAPDTKA